MLQNDMLKNYTSLIKKWENEYCPHCFNDMLFPYSLFSPSFTWFD